MKKVDVSDSTRIIYTQSNFAFVQLLSVECPDTNTNKSVGQMQIKHKCKKCSYYSQYLRQFVVKIAFDRLKDFLYLALHLYCVSLYVAFFAFSFSATKFLNLF